MSFSLANPLTWTTGDLLTEDQINQLDAEHAAAVDGSGGGTYTLTAPLSITGDDFTVSDLTAATITTTGNCTLGNSSGDTTTTRQLHVINNLTLDGNAVISGAVDIAGLLSVDDNVDITGDLDVTGEVLSNSLDVTGTGQFLGQLKFLFKISAGPNADHAYTALDAGQIIYSESLSSNRAYTFSGGFSAGDWFLFKHRASGGATLTVNLVDLVVAQGIFWFYTGTNWRFFKLDETFA